MTLIEFFDKDTIKNILAVLTLEPDRVVYIYDDAIKDKKYFDALNKCFKKHIPQIRVEAVAVNNNSVSDIYEKTISIINSDKDCMMELTGGSELMMIAGHKAGSERKIQMLYTDIAAGTITDIENPEWVKETAVLTLDDFIDAKGAAYAGGMHNEPEERDFDKILEMSRYLFRNLREWRFTCIYLQAVTSASENKMKISANTPFMHKDGRKYHPDRNILEMFEKCGFIKNLYITENRVNFSYVFPEARVYLTTYGLWLEMYVFISAKRTGKFSDVKLGTMIDWDAYDENDTVGNEIDVILMEKSIPIFVSCKLREISTPDLNELYIEKKRLGGWFSKGVIVTSGDDKIKKTGVFKKAEEFGIIVMDRKDIKSKNYGELLFDAVSSQNIVDMKWKRV